MKRPDTKKTIDNDEKPYRINPQYVCDLETYCEELEKALDKAIVSLTFADHLLGVGKSTYSYDQWKNWLLSQKTSVDHITKEFENE